MTWTDAQQLSVRPSDLLAIEDPYVAYCFDQAAGYLGSHIELELDKIGHKPDARERSNQEAKRKKLDAILNGEAGGKETTKFADPALMF